MSAALSLLAGAVTALALLLFAVAGRSWLHVRSPRVMLLAAAFLLLVAKGILLSIAIFQDADWEGRYMVPSLALDAGALVLLYLAVLRKS